MLRSRVVASLALAALLAGCGGATQTGAPTAVQNPTAAPAATSAPAATNQPAATNPAAPTAAPATAEAAAGQPPALSLRPLANGLSQPTQITNAADGSGRLFVVEKPGRIAIMRDGAVQDRRMLDITDRVGSSGSEQGLLSVSFHPRFRENGYLYVDYTDRNGNTVVSRFTASGDSADPASEKVLLRIDQPYPNHNGGQTMFGPDGYLYIGTGDGGSAGDPQRNGQNPNALLGKILRIDVNGGDPYAIPPDNPFATGGGRPEIWAIGLRNPWRFSFDRSNGDLYIGDVGQNQYEEIDMLPAGSGSGANLGWNVMEGDSCYRADSCDQQAFTPPITVYSHDFGCSVTGGFVYRGEAVAGLQGSYVFGDYCSGNLWTLTRDSSGAWQRSEPFPSNLRLSSFGEDEAGELYAVSLDGGIYQVIAA